VKRIVNMVFITELPVEGRIQLHAAAKYLSQYGDARYDPKRFPGLIYVSKREGLSALLFSNGKMVVHSSSVEAAERTVARAASAAEASGARVKWSERVKLKVVNIVAVGDLGGYIDLERAAEDAACGAERTEYYPDNFPGVICRRGEGTLLVFSNGKVLIAGAKDVGAVDALYEFAQKRFSPYIERPAQAQAQG